MTKSQNHKKNNTEKKQKKRPCSQRNLQTKEMVCPWRPLYNYSSVMVSVLTCAEAILFFLTTTDYNNFRIFGAVLLSVRLLLAIVQFPVHLFIVVPARRTVENAAYATSFFAKVMPGKTLVQLIELCNRAMIPFIASSIMWIIFMILDNLHWSLVLLEVIILAIWLHTYVWRMYAKITDTVGVTFPWAT